MTKVYKTVDSLMLWMVRFVLGETHDEANMD